MNIEQQIKHGMALAFFASAYADQADKAGEPLRGEIMDQLPDEIDPAALHEADALTRDMVRANGKPLANIYRDAEECDNEGADRELEPELFGHFCAMQAMGHGVGLESFGNVVRDSVRVPHVEFGLYSLEIDYFTDHDADR